MLNINGIDLELDLMDADIAEKYEKSIKEMDQKEKNKLVEGKSFAEIIRQECNIVFDFFNSVWGEGTDKKIFGSKTNYSECEDAFKKVVEYSNQQIEKLNKKALKYSSNRASRRVK